MSVLSFSLNSTSWTFANSSILNSVQGVGANLAAKVHGTDGERCNRTQQPPNDASTGSQFNHTHNGKHGGELRMGSTTLQTRVPDSASSKGNHKADLAAVLHDATELIQAAERMIRESCGEAWLLQPYIVDLPQGEYRCVPDSVNTGLA